MASALAALALRLVALGQPLRADEAGFLIVARTWDPRPGHLYGPYFVDRPPLLIAVVKLADLVGGDHFLRVVGALGCVLLVLTAAGAAREIAGVRAAKWTAMAVAALSCNAMLDVVSVKGELLALPLLMGGCWAALVAVRRRSPALALLAGLLGGSAVGLKQNLTGALVFGAVLLVASWRNGRLDGRTTARLLGVALTGAALPWAGTVLWAIAAGVRLTTLEYAVVGFRLDASRVIASAPSAASERRALLLVAVAVGAGMVLLAAGFVRHLREVWRLDPATTAATAAMLLTDAAGLALGGSYWTDYLLPLVPGLALATSLLCATLDRRRGRRSGVLLRAVVLGAVASTLVSVTVLGAVRLHQPNADAATGQAIGGVAEPGDTLTVFGGSADLQYASGLRSPYPYLWSLPMRTLDPGYHRLVGLLESARAPTWLVVALPTGSWHATGAEQLDAAIADRYVEVGVDCRGGPIELRRGRDRAAPAPVCS